jgi:hypothetical protein
MHSSGVFFHDRLNMSRRGSVEVGCRGPGARGVTGARRSHWGGGEAKGIGGRQAHAKGGEGARRVSVAQCAPLPATSVPGGKAVVGRMVRVEVGRVVRVERRLVHRVVRVERRVVHRVPPAECTQCRNSVRQDLKDLKI